VTVYARTLWDRALRARKAAEQNLQIDPDTAASRAYYAAFYAASAHFALQDRTFDKHTALEAAVHRDLVHSGLWPQELGAAYSRLMQLRARGDYGGAQHVSTKDAEQAVRFATEILRAVAQAHPDEFASLPQ
jgi:uncharacterized protein (UPF0332 family)